MGQEKEEEEEEEAGQEEEEEEGMGAWRGLGSEKGSAENAVSPRLR